MECSVPLCNRQHSAKGLCAKHYLRQYYTRGATTEPHQRGPFLCSIEGCGQQAVGKGLCNKHYLRKWLRGTTELAPKPTETERFWAKVEQSVDSCWLWHGALINTGYGVTRWEGRLLLAHRVMYRLVVGPIPDGLTVDHLCFVRACVRPDHLEAVTQAENNRRARERKAAFTA